MWRGAMGSASAEDRKSTRLNSSHTEIYTLSLHDALPIFQATRRSRLLHDEAERVRDIRGWRNVERRYGIRECRRSEEHTSELQSHRDLHSFPTRRSSDLSSNAPEPATA